MDKIKERAKEFLYNNIDEDDLYESDLWESDFIEAMMQFAKECCEMQKEECYRRAKIVYDKDANLMISPFGYIIDKNSILNCKNICDES